MFRKSCKELLSGFNCSKVTIKNGRIFLDPKWNSQIYSRFFSESNQNEQDLIFESWNGKGHIIFNRPKKFNSCTIPMAQKLMKSLMECKKSRSIVIIRGQGEKAFCVGGDVLELCQSVSSGSDSYMKHIQTIYTCCALIHEMKIPCIALMDGIAFGEGFGLGTACRYRVATEKSIFASPEIKIGLFPDNGVRELLLNARKPDQTGSKLGLFLGMTGHQLEGSDNFTTGFATHMCSSSQINQLEEELISMSNSKTLDAQEIEKILKYYTNLCPDSKKPFSLEGHLEKIDKLFSGKSVEEIFTNLERDSSKWSRNVLKILERSSPTALKIIFKYFEMSQKLNFKERLMIEYPIIIRCMRASDFNEGVQIVMKDRNRKPKWHPPTLKDVSDAHVNSFFEPLPKDQGNLNLEHI